jgi:2-keto-3-deoxy-L-rhamnonate aldolase RhmA
MTSQNKTLHLIRQGRPAIGMFFGLASYDAAEIVSTIGLDWLLFDLEHGEIFFDSLPKLLSVTSASETTPIVRVPCNDPVYAKLALDKGAQGVMFPQVESKEEAVRAVRACKYPPQGVRGIGPRRAALRFSHGSVADYFEVANDETMVIVMIESKRSVENIDDILSVEGIDGIMIGPNDLAASMGYIESLPNRGTEIDDAIETILRAAKEHGVAAGMPAGGNHQLAISLIKRGFRIIEMGEDTDYLLRSRQDLEKIRDKTKG